MPLVALVAPVLGSLGVGSATAGLIGAGASVAGSLIAGGSAGQAAGAQTDAASEANALQKYMYDTTRTDQQPWREAGAAALGKISGGLDEFNRPFGIKDFQTDPGYQWQLDEGRRMVEGSAAAAGLLNSGGTLKALTRYGQGLANQSYQDAYNRYNNDRSSAFNRLASVAGLGQTANNQTGQAGQNYANQAGQNLLLAGQARAQGIQNQAGIQTNLLGNLAGLGSNMLNQFGRQAVPSYDFGVSGLGGGNPFADVGAGSFGPSTSYNFGTSGIAF